MSLSCLTERGLKFLSTIDCTTPPATIKSYTTPRKIKLTSQIAAGNQHYPITTITCSLASPSKSIWWAGALLTHQRWVRIASVENWSGRTRCSLLKCVHRCIIHATATQSVQLASRIWSWRVQGSAMEPPVRSWTSRQTSGRCCLRWTLHATTTALAPSTRVKCSYFAALNNNLSSISTR